MVAKSQVVARACEPITTLRVLVIAKERHPDSRRVRPRVWTVSQPCHGSTQEDQRGQRDPDPAQLLLTADDSPHGHAQSFWKLRSLTAARSLGIPPRNPALTRRLRWNSSIRIILAMNPPLSLGAQRGPRGALATPLVRPCPSDQLRDPPKPPFLQLAVIGQQPDGDDSEHWQPGRPGTHPRH